MSDPQFDTLANATEVEADAAAWLERSVSESWNEGDEAALEEWLAASPAHTVAFWRLKAAWMRTRRLAALGENAVPVGRSPARFAPTLLKLAAGFVVAAIVGLAAANYVLRPHDRTFSTPIGGHEIVSFADGSKIELNTDTVLRARMTTDQRIVWLERGEAFFQIKHDPAHPFVVMAGNHRVTDLGTQFSVRRDSEKLRVAVLQGRVTVDATNGDNPSQIALLTPGEVATAVAGKISVRHAPRKALTLSLSWRHGALVFDNTSLSDAAAEFNRYNAQKLVIADPAVADLRIYGTFRADNVNDFTQLAEAVFGLKSVTHGDRILISR